MTLTRFKAFARESGARSTDGSEVLLTVSHITGVTTRSEKTVYMFEAESLEGYKVVEPGDLVVNTMWAWMGALVVARTSGIVSPSYGVYRLDARVVDPRYVEAYLRQPQVVAEITARSTGVWTSRLRLYAEDLLDMRIDLPPLAAQRAIANYLDGETARIDALVAASRRQRLLAAERLRAHVVATMRRLAEVVGSIPLKRVVTCLDGRRIPLNAEERGSRQGIYPYYGASSIVDHVDDYLFDEVLVLLGEDGAQLGDPEYPIAQVVTGKVWVNNHAHVLRAHGDPWFLVFHLNTFDRMSFTSGATREKITQEAMGSIPVPNLTPERQAAIAAELRVEQGRVDAMTLALDQRAVLLLERRQALITAAVTGQLEIPGVAA